jgi:integrase/recombinase XerD
LGGSAATRNQHLSTLRGFFDRLVERHVLPFDGAASASAVKETVVDGKTPETRLSKTGS